MNERYGISVSQSGSGQSYGSPSLSDESSVGRAIFIRDNDSGEYWNIGHYPSEKPFDTFQAIHGLGYSTISSSANKIESSITFFVPQIDSCEIWQLKINNNQKRKRRLSVFIYTELPEIENCDTKLKNNCLFISSKGSTDSPDKLYFLGLDHAIDSFDTDSEIFIGPYRSIKNPRALEDGKCSRSQASRNPIGVIQRNITLGANTSSEFLVIAGSQTIAPNNQTFAQANAIAIRKAQVLLGKYRRAHVAESSLEAVKKYWGEIENKMKVNSPDDVFNSTQSLWIKYQMINRFNARKELEITAELAEDTAHICSLLPERAKKKLKGLLSRQLKDGRTIKWFNRSDHSTYISEKIDGPVWLIIATASLVNETGRVELLKERVPYFDGGSGNVLEHLIRAAKHCLKHLNHQNIIEVNGKESNYLTSIVYYALKELLPLLESSKEHHLVKTYQQTLEAVKKSFNRRFWDGGWYLVSRNHQRVGSKKNQQRKIDLAAQVFPVAFGLADDKKAEKALSNAWHHLNSPAGLAGFTPTYLNYHPENPESRDSSGERANGGINIKTASLALASETRLGRGDLAYKIFQQHNPVYRSENQETYKIEPFYFADYLFGPASFKHGRGDNRMTGNASGWMWKNINEGILGIQPVLGGLKIDPCIPRNWRQVEFSRHFRGAEYHIRILNPTRQTKGVDRIMVDGVRQTGNFIRPFQTGIHYVEVFLG